MLQKRIFDYLKTLLPAGQNLAEAIGNTLHISSDSVYRRLRGETPMTVDELLELCKRFGVSADQLLSLQDERMVMFQVNRTESTAPSFSRYVGNILASMEALQATGVTQLIYASKDLPLFHCYSIPEFFAFKYHFWMHVIVQDPSFENKPFQKALPDEGLQKIIRQSAQIYNSIPSTEIWNSESINSTLLQIDFYKHSQSFGDPAVITGLYDLLDELLGHIEKQAELGCKFLPGEPADLKPRHFTLLSNQVAMSDNTMLVQTPYQQIAVLNYGVLNYLQCQHQAFCKTVATDLENMMRRATKLSMENVRQRARFFNRMHEKVAWYKKQVM